MRSNQRVAGLFENYKHYVFLSSVFFISAIVYFFVYLFHAPFKNVMSIASYLTWHSLFEFSGILVCLCVFFVSYYSYGQTGILRVLFLGNVFLTVGLIDTFHTLSFKGMPEFFISNTDANRATTFWIIARLFGGIGYLIASFIPAKKKSTMRKEIFVIPALLISFLIFVIVTYFPNFLPKMYIEGRGLTPVKIDLEYILIALLVAAVIRFVLEYNKTKDLLMIYFSSALLLSIFSEFAFTKYLSVYDMYNYVGHIYKTIAFFIIFKIIFVNNVQKPYFELNQAKEALENYAENLDKIIDQRTQEIKIVNQKLLEDLEYAKDIQRAMLPSELPQEQDVSFEARYFPAERVSGDFYNVFLLDKENIGFYIGDVAGHGVSAAMLTVFVNQNIQTLKEVNENKVEIISPSFVLTNLYRSFNNTNFKEEIYIVLFYAVYNLKTRELTYSSAGLNVEPLIIKNSGEIKEIHIKGFPICKLSEYISDSFEESTLRLETGDKILLYTDGLIEMENTDYEMYSQDRLKNVLVKNSRKSKQVLAEIVTRDVFDFIGTGKIKDDITFFIMQVD